VPIPQGASAALGADFSEASWRRGLERGLRNPRAFSPLSYPCALRPGDRVPVVLGAHVGVVSGHLAGVAAKLWTVDCPVAAIEGGAPATVAPAEALLAAKREGAVRAFGAAKGAPPALPPRADGGEEEEAPPGVLSIMPLEGVMDD
jgi:hypothetical protein